MSELKSTSLQNQLTTALKTDGPRYARKVQAMLALVAALRAEEAKICEGGGAKAVEAQHKKQRLTARERIGLLLDKGTELFELGLHAAHRMYEE